MASDKIDSTFQIVCNDNDETHPRRLIPELLKQMYDLGWVFGTGGGISVRQGELIYISPSSVQKERIVADELFVVRMPADQSAAGDYEVIEAPPAKKALRQSQCTPLFLNAYTMRNAGAVLHTHSKWANLVTQLCSSSGATDEFRISHQEMIKGIRDQTTGKALRYDDTLVVPIIDNTLFEEDLQEPMAEVMRRYPSTCAVLVRHHGVYVWGDTWQKAKAMCETYEYLFELACEMTRLGLPLLKNGGKKDDICDLVANT